MVWSRYVGLWWRYQVKWFDPEMEGYPAVKRDVTPFQTFLSTHMSTAAIWWHLSWPIGHWQLLYFTVCPSTWTYIEHNSLLTLTHLKDTNVSLTILGAGRFMSTFLTSLTLQNMTYIFLVLSSFKFNVLPVLNCCWVLLNSEHGITYHL